MENSLNERLFEPNRSINDSSGNATKINIEVSQIPVKRKLSSCRHFNNKSSFKFVTFVMLKIINNRTLKFMKQKSTIDFVSKGTRTLALRRTADRL